MPAYLVRARLVGLGFINPVMLVLGPSLAYSRFVVEKFTVKKKKIQNKKMYCFYRINLLECVPGVRIEAVNNEVRVIWLHICNVRY